MSEEDAAAAARLIALNMLATLKCESGRLTMQQSPIVCIVLGMVVRWWLIRMVVALCCAIMTETSNHNLLLCVNVL